MRHKMKGRCRNPTVIVTIVLKNPWNSNREKNASSR